MKGYASEADELRAATREAHETMKDLAALVKQAEDLLGKLENQIPELIAVQMDEVITGAVTVGLEHYSQTINAATEAATDAVFDRFDKIMSIIMGTDRKGRARGHSIPEMLTAAQQAGIISKEVDVTGLSQPLSREIADWDPNRRTT